jgi:nucleoid DNA-binding protein
MADAEDEDVLNTGKGRVKPVVVSTRAVRSGSQLKKKDMVERVAAASGVKRADARAVLDAALALIGERLAAGDELQLPPLGRLRMLREKDNGRARIATLRLQVAGEDEAGKDPLAEDGD